MKDIVSGVQRIDVFYFFSNQTEEFEVDVDIFVNLVQDAITEFQVPGTIITKILVMVIFTNAHIFSTIFFILVCCT